MKEKIEKAVLVGIQQQGEGSESLQELQDLVRTVGAEVQKVFVQRIRKINPSTYIGKGKVDEILQYIKENDVDIVIIDESLSPGQESNLQTIFELPVLDRTAVILDIFAQHAHTKEGSLQVELAQLHYRLPRLVGSKKYLSRLGGGIGTQGPGETQLEVDRRRIRERIGHIKEELSQVRQHRELHRKKRQEVPLPVISLIGYTNAGKSTLLNHLCKKDVVRAEDKLFATLDPTTRRIILPNKQPILVTDTVGFIKKLPYHLVEAFKATFEEIGESDLLIHVIDGSHPLFAEQAETVLKVLEEMKFFHKPILHVYNKFDLFQGDRERFLKNPKLFPSLLISAEKNINLDELLLKIQEMLPHIAEEITLVLPLDEKAQKTRAFISEYGKILEERVENEELHIKACVLKKAAEYLRTRPLQQKKN